MNGFWNSSVVKTLTSERYIEYMLIRVIVWPLFIWTLQLAQIKHVLSAICLSNISLRVATALVSLYSSYVITNIAAPHPVETSRFQYSMAKHSNTHIITISMAVKHNNVLLNLITGCLYWLTTCFGQLHDHHQVYKR
jgi:hypothetical protein